MVACINIIFITENRLLFTMADLDILTYITIMAVKFASAHYNGRPLIATGVRLVDIYFATALILAKQAAKRAVVCYDKLPPVMISSRLS